MSDYVGWNISDFADDLVAKQSGLALAQRYAEDIPRLQREVKQLMDGIRAILDGETPDQPGNGIGAESPTLTEGVLGVGEELCDIYTGPVEALGDVIGGAPVTVVIDATDEVSEEEASEIEAILNDDTPFEAARPAYMANPAE